MQACWERSGLTHTDFCCFTGLLSVALHWPQHALGRSWVWSIRACKKIFLYLKALSAQPLTLHWRVRASYPPLCCIRGGSLSWFVCLCISILVFCRVALTDGRLQTLLCYVVSVHTAVSGRTQHGKRLRQVMHVAKNLQQDQKLTLIKREYG